jgi:hypothetical protein
MPQELEYVTWPERCLTCAYRPGTPASKSELTLLKAKLCAMTSEPFYCHEDPNERALCKGWVDTMEIRLDQIGKGTRTDEPEWRRQVFLALTEVIVECEDLMKLNLPFDAEEIIHRKMMGIKYA